QDHFTEWLDVRSSFLDELLRHDGPGDNEINANSLCKRCNEGIGSIRCRDCANGGQMYCTSCTLDLHRFLPLHRIERWNSTYFDKTSLNSLGFRYQVGHHGDKCPVPVQGPKSFVLFDITGVHFLSLDYCGCGYQSSSTSSDQHYVQLLREKWFPATLSRPQTVFTFECLELFHELTLQGKTNLYDYYHTLLRRFDNASIHHSAINRFTEIHRVFRMWRDLMAPPVAATLMYQM
ncbi:hypothetical protein CPC08DRAFT_807184, partial [Agrocybe pediades]